MDSDGFASLNGLRAVVTGSSSGIGKAVALELARGGADVLIHCRETVENADAVAGEIRDMGRQAEVRAADLADPAERRDLAEEAWTDFGPVDIWINNAGADVLTGRAAKLDFEQKLQKLLDVDVRATVLLGRDVGRRMREAGGGVILNVGWDQATRGMEGDSGELFATAKNATMGFSRSLALSLAPTVRVNCIAPGWIKTAWGEKAGGYWQERVRRETPLERWGTPEDIARMARFLASSEAAYITGQVINVNGGAVR